MTGSSPQSADTKPVAFAAVITDQWTCETAIQEICQHTETLSHAGADNLHFYHQTIDSQEVLLACMDFNSAVISADAIEAWEFIISVVPLKTHFSKLELGICSHPRHVNDPNKSTWVQTETVCKLRLDNAVPANSQSTWHAAVTGLKVEKEAEYRLLHDNVWPGVTRAIGASNISRFDIFLIEFGDNQPYLFYQFLYTGNDFDNDMNAQSNCPVTQRWWKYTDACQQPLPAAKDSPWLDLETIN